MIFFFMLISLSFRFVRIEIHHYAIYTKLYVWRIYIVSILLITWIDKIHFQFHAHQRDTLREFLFIRKHPGISPNRHL